MRPETPVAAFTAIVLAAQRAGRRDPLAEDAGVSHKCLVPIAGKPLIAHVLRTIAATPGIAEIRISVEAEAFDGLRPLLALIDAPIALIASADNLADSVNLAAADATGPIIITTADNVLLSVGAVEAILRRLAQRSDVAVALATREAVLAAHPEGQRRFYEFRDDAYSNCNLYAMADTRALKAAEAFRGGGQFAKSAKRIIAAFGLVNLVLLRFRLVSIDGAMRRVGRRFGLRMAAVILDDGAHAIDVDNARTYAIARELMERRAAKPSPAFAKVWMRVLSPPEKGQDPHPSLSREGGRG